MENSSEHVFIYCERGLNPAFWAEPLNALTNFAFILAAIFAFAFWRDKGKSSQTPKWQVITLILLSVTVGAGSFIFHTFATKTSMLADVIPIIIFIHFAIYVTFRRVYGLKVLQAIIGVILFAAANFLLLKIFGRTFLNGSIQYLLTLVFLLFTSFYCRHKKLHANNEFGMAALAFLVSMTCRSTDMMVCSQIPLGLHFMWHVLNAVTMYYVIKGLIKASR